MTRQQEYEIIELVVAIFQNVGIKRCIDKIDILKNYQIYFEICKVIFPQTMIQLLRFSEGPKTNAQKIQGVIDIVGKILQNDLYHISGIAIAEGKLSHIRNFLHILQLLSQNVHKGNRNEQQVESAPQNTRSVSDFDQQGHYTVIGIDKQFERSYDDEEGNHLNQNHQETSQQGHTNRQYPPRKAKQNEFQQALTDNQDSQSQRPMNPVMSKKQPHSKKKFVKTKPQPHKSFGKVIVHEVIPKAFKKSAKTFKKKETLQTPTLESFVKRKDAKEETRKKFKSDFVRKINNVIEDFEAKRITDLKLQYNIWARKHEMKNAEKENQIEEENKERLQLANHFIGERKKKIESLRNAEQAINVLSNLFKQQKNIWRGMRKAKEEAQLQEIQGIIQNDSKDQQLLRQALMINAHQNYGKNKK